jgi:hypothetical protein
MRHARQKRNNAFTSEAGFADGSREPLAPPGSIRERVNDTNFSPGVSK